MLLNLRSYPKEKTKLELWLIRRFIPNYTTWVKVGLFLFGKFFGAIPLLAAILGYRRAYDRVWFPRTDPPALYLLPKSFLITLLFTGLGTWALFFCFKLLTIAMFYIASGVPQPSTQKKLKEEHRKISHG